MKDLRTVIFSKDRALQLEAVLRSFFLRCVDRDMAAVAVLCAASDQRQQRSYDVLASEYKDVEFVKEKDFKADMLSLLSGIRFVCFLVDDNIFVDDFSFSDCIMALCRHKDALGVSLRLGRNTGYCYMLDKPQSLPAFSDAGKGMFIYNWPGCDHDFSYPLEVSSSIYRVDELMPLFSKLQFSNPNQLESAIAPLSKLYAQKRSRLLCYETSRTFCAPVNIVQQVCCENRAAREAGYSVAELLEIFESGRRIDVEKFYKFVPEAAHQEVVFDFAA